MSSIMKFAKCPECGGAIATQMGDDPVKDLSWAHEHKDGAPSEFGHEVRNRGESDGEA